MPNDITLQSMFDYPKQGIVNGLEFSLLTKVIATFGEHLANDHPTSNPDLADLVTSARIPSLKVLSSKFGQVRRFTRILARQNGIESVPSRMP